MAPGDVLLRGEAHLEVVREGVEDGEVAPDVAVLAGRLAAGADGLDGVRPGEPGGHVDGVDVLLDDHVAAEGAGLIPGAEPLLRGGRGAVVVHAGGPGIARHAALQPADRTLVDPPQRLVVEVVGPGLEVDQVDELPGRGLPARLGDGHAAGHVHGHRLGEVDVLAGLDRGRGLLGMEVGRALDHHRVERRVEQPLVARERRVPAAAARS